MSNYSVWLQLVAIIMFVVICLYVHAVYFEFDECLSEFVSKLVTFFSLVILISVVGSIFPCIVFWEFVGWVSFRLIALWAERVAVYKSGLVALCTNKCGDVIFAIVFGLAALPSLTKCLSEPVMLYIYIYIFCLFADWRVYYQ